jgi:hypothetical protein
MPVHLDVHLPLNHRLDAVSGVGGLDPWRRPPCYRPGPHAQIFYSWAGALNYFFEYRVFKRATPGGGLISGAKSVVRPSLGRTHLREIRIYFFIHPSNRCTWATRKNRREIQVGGVSSET